MGNAHAHGKINVLNEAGRIVNVHPRQQMRIGFYKMESLDIVLSELGQC
jgi:hypothetical protein